MALLIIDFSGLQTKASAMKYLVIDAALNGTGIRDKYEGGYILPHTLPLSSTLVVRLEKWLRAYEISHYNQYSDNKLVNELDTEGKEIAFQFKSELVDVKIEYYSDARMTREII